MKAANRSIRSPVIKKLVYRKIETSFRLIAVGCGLSPIIRFVLFKKTLGAFPGFPIERQESQKLANLVLTPVCRIKAVHPLPTLISKSTQNKSSDELNKFILFCLK